MQKTKMICKLPGKWAKVSMSDTKLTSYHHAARMDDSAYPDPLLCRFECCRHSSGDILYCCCPPRALAIIASGTLRHCRLKPC